MDVKINIPTSLDDITVRQFQRYLELSDRDLPVLEYAKRKIEIFTGLGYRDIPKLAAVDFDDILAAIDVALQTGGDFRRTFTMKGQEFGFIPNLDKITQYEWAALSEYGEDPRRFHELMAVLFRPVKDKDAFGNYTIVAYEDNPEMDEIMKDTPMSIVNGALVFFYRLENELSNHTQKSTRVEPRKGLLRRLFSRSTAGLQPST